MVHLMTIIILVLSLNAVAKMNQTLYQCPECKGAKRIKYDSFYSKCKLCKGKDLVNIKDIYKSDIIDFYIFKRKKSLGSRAVTGSYHMKKQNIKSRLKAFYNPYTKELKIEEKRRQSRRNKKDQVFLRNKHGDGFKSSMKKKRKRY